MKIIANIKIDNRSWNNYLNHCMEIISYGVKEDNEKRKRGFDEKEYLKKALLSVKNIKSEELQKQCYDRICGYIERVNKTEDAKKLTSEMLDFSKELRHKRPSTEVYEFVSFIHDIINYNSMAYTDFESPEQSADKIETSMKMEYQNETMPVLKEIEERLKKFLNVNKECNFSFEISPYFDKDNLYENYSDITYHLNIGNKSSAPGFTLFRDNGKFEVDDVLEYGDTDFFDDISEQKYYFQLVDYFRTGRLVKEQKFLRLYRGMSSDEYFKWKSGTVIPQGKFFTSEKTSAYSQDISGEYPELFEFMVDNNIVVETDNHTYQTVEKAKLKQNKIIAV